ncbi:hypothetical protein D3C71_1342740 [compost metagenome]
MIQRQVQLFSDDLCQRSTDPGAQIHVAVEPIDLAVVVDRNEQRQLLGFDHGYATFGHRAGRWLDLIDDQQDAGLGQQLSTGERCMGHGHQSVQDF